MGSLWRMMSSESQRRLLGPQLWVPIRHRLVLWDLSHLGGRSSKKGPYQVLIHDFEGLTAFIHVYRIMPRS